MRAGRLRERRLEMLPKEDGSRFPSAVPRFANVTEIVVGQEENSSVPDEIVPESYR